MSNGKEKEKKYWKYDPNDPEIKEVRRLRKKEQQDFYTPRIEVMMVNVKKLFETETLTGIDEKDAIIIDPSLFVVYSDLFDPVCKLSIHACKNKKNIADFVIPLYNTGEEQRVLKYLLNETKYSLPPEPLGSAVDSFMKGWLPILKTMNSLTEWEHTVEVIQKEVDDGLTDIRIGYNQYLLRHSDNGTVAHLMKWKAEYKGANQRQKMGVSFKNYKDRDLHIFSWVDGGAVKFQIKTTDDGDNYTSFKLSEIEELISKINIYFNTSSKILDQASKLANQGRRLANLAKKKFSETVNGKGSAP
jgi:hypothetical protein